MKSGSWRGAYRTVVMVVALGVLLGPVPWWLGCFSPNRDKSATDSEELVVAMTREPLGSLMVIASMKEFFAEEGVNVRIVEGYPSGKRALAGLLSGEVAVAPTSEVPIVFRSFERTDFAIVATIGSSDDEPKIVASKASGIETPSDLRGKRVATQRASAVHYFLYLFLLRHRIPREDITPVYMKAEDLPGALADGDIDAFCMREPFINEARALTDGEVKVFSEPGLYVKTFNLIVLKRVIRARPGAVRRILRALVRAEEFAREHPEEVIDIVAQQLKINPQALAETWPEMDLRVSLGQQLLRSLEDEAMWALESDFVKAQHVPNYLGFLHLGALTEVKRTAVTVID